MPWDFWNQSFPWTHLFDLIILDQKTKQNKTTILSTQMSTNNYKQLRFTLKINQQLWPVQAFKEPNPRFSTMLKTWQIMSACLSEMNLKCQNNTSEICVTWWEENALLFKPVNVNKITDMLISTKSDITN